MIQRVAVCCKAISGKRVNGLRRANRNRKGVWATQTERYSGDCMMVHDINTLGGTRDFILLSYTGRSFFIKNNGHRK